MQIEAGFRPAVLADAALLAELVNYAGEGLPHHLWAAMAGEGEDAWSVGLERARRDAGSFSWRNATMALDHDTKAGCLIGYEIEALPDPITDDIPAIVRPLCELEMLAPDSWYVNVLAVRPPLRRRGHGTRLLQLAERFGRQARRSQMSVIVSDGNPGAWRLYAACGYRTAAKRSMVKDGWDNPGSNWVLLTKPL